MHLPAYDHTVDSVIRSAAECVSDVTAALASRTAEVAADIFALIVQEIPQLRSDQRVLTLLEASVDENVTTVLHILQHEIALQNVRAPSAAEEYARRLAQQGVPIAALLRAYRLGSARFEEWCLQELARRTDSAPVVSAAGLRIAGILAGYIDLVSEEIVSAYESERGNWLRNLSIARAARVHAILRGERVDTDSAEAVLGYRLRQNHVGVVAWTGGTASIGDPLRRLEQAIAEVAVGAYGGGPPLFVPYDESCAWAWLPLGGHHSLPVGLASACGDGPETSVRFAFGAPARGVSGFRRTHQQAASAQAVALAAGPSGQLVTTFSDVAPLALMSGSMGLLHAWVTETLGPLADDDTAHARLRATLSVFLQENGSFKAAAERLTLHKNTVQYRVRKAEEILGRPVGEDRLNIELALLASQWLGRAVLRPAREPRTDRGQPADPPGDAASLGG